MSILQQSLNSPFRSILKRVRPQNHSRIRASISSRNISLSSPVNAIDVEDATLPFVPKGNIARPHTDRNLASPNVHLDIEDFELDDTLVYDREFVDMKVEDYQSLYENDKTGQTKALVEAVLNEYEFLKYNSMGRVPSNIPLIDMQRFIDECTTPSARTKMFHFLYKREMDKRCATLRQERRKIETQKRLDVKYQIMSEKFGDKRSGLISDKNGQLIYGLWHNSLFCRIPDRALKFGASNSRLRTAALFGRKLIIDFDFEDYMNPWICRNMMDQVQVAYGLNRFHYAEPFDLWFCNFNQDTPGGKYMLSNAITNLLDTSMITVKSDCFTNHFDKSRLVYLSPNAKDRLEWNDKSDDVYIIGGFNDKAGAKPLTFRKATKMGIRTRCLPLDTYLAWQGGSKSLCVNHVVGILLEVMARGGTWQEALIKHIPHRKIKPIEVLIEEEKRKSEKKLRILKGKRFSIRDDLELE